MKQVFVKNLIVIGLRRTRLFIREIATKIYMDASIVDQFWRRWLGNVARLKGAGVAKGTSASVDRRNH